MFSIPEAILQRLAVAPNANHVVQNATVRANLQQQQQQQPEVPPNHEDQAARESAVPGQKKSKSKASRSGRRRLVMPSASHSSSPRHGTGQQVLGSDVIRFGSTSKRRRGSSPEKDGEDDTDEAQDSIWSSDEEGYFSASDDDPTGDHRAPQAGTPPSRCAPPPHERLAERRRAVVDRDFAAVHDPLPDALLSSEEEEGSQSEEGTFSSATSDGAESSFSGDSDPDSETVSTASASSRSSRSGSALEEEVPSGEGGFLGLRRKTAGTSGPNALETLLQRNNSRTPHEPASPQRPLASPSTYSIRPPQCFRSLYFETHLPEPTPSTSRVSHHTLVAFQAPYQRHHHHPPPTPHKKQRRGPEQPRELPSSSRVPPPSVTIQGPCAVLGGIGGRRKEELEVSGFHLGSASPERLHGRSVTLWSDKEQAVLQPTRRAHSMTSSPTSTQGVRVAKTWKSSIEAMTAAPPSEKDEETRGERGVFQPDALRALVCGPGKGGLVFPHASSAAPQPFSEEDVEEEDVEDVFGPIDWAWVHSVLDTWKGFFGGAEHVPAVGLILHPYEPQHRTGARRFYLKQNLKQQMKKAKRARRREQKRRRLAIGGDEDPQRSAPPNAGRNEEVPAITLPRRNALLRGKVSGAGDTSGHAFMEVPSFIARHRLPHVDQKVLPQLLPDLVSATCTPTGGILPPSKTSLRNQKKQLNSASSSPSESGSCAALPPAGLRMVMVVGSTSTGKSSLCRYLANTFLSLCQQGGAGGVLWLDLDLGQPEFGVPGELGLYRVHHPLFHPHQIQSVEPIHTLFVGSRTVVCPLTTAHAIASMCDLVQALQQQHREQSTQQPGVFLYQPLPVVINTHGWVLHTGRRTTVEVLRRLQPRHVLHLLRENEFCWTQPVSRSSAADHSRRGEPGEPRPELTSAYAHRHFVYGFPRVPHEPDAEDRETPLVAPWMLPENGLNAEVVKKRFLLRVQSKLNPPQKSTAADGSVVWEDDPQPSTPNGVSLHSPNSNSNSSGVQVLSRLPPAKWAHLRLRATGPLGSGRSVPLPPPPGTMTTVHVIPVLWEIPDGGIGGLRNFNAAHKKGIEARRQRWLDHLMPLVTHYTERHEERAETTENAEDDDGAASSSSGPTEEEPRTTLLRAPITQLQRVVLAEEDEKTLAEVTWPPRESERVRQQHLAAMLERAVVAVQIGVTSASSCHTLQNPLEDGALSVPSCSLASLSAGFPVTCYGFVESSEAELLGETLDARGDARSGREEAEGKGGMICIRVPLPPAVVQRLLTDAVSASSSASASSEIRPAVGIALGYAEGLRAETNFMELLFDGGEA